MAATFKIVLHSQPNNDGSFTVSLRVTFQRKNRYFSLGRRCKKSQWEESASRFTRTYPDYREENDVLRTYEQRAADALRSFERDDLPFSWERFQLSVFPDARVTHTKDVVGYLREVAAEMERIGKHGNGMFYKNTATVVHAYKPKATLSDLDADWLHRWETWMRTKRDLNNGGMSILFRTLRAACNRAIKKDKVMPRSWWPYGHLIGSKRSPLSSSHICPFLVGFLNVGLYGSPFVHRKRCLSQSARLIDVPPTKCFGCGLITRRVCVFRPSSIARTIEAEKSMGRSFMGKSCLECFKTTPRYSDLLPLSSNHGALEPDCG